MNSDQYNDSVLASVATESAHVIADAITRPIDCSVLQRRGLWCAALPEAAFSELRMARVRFFWQAIPASRFPKPLARLRLGCFYSCAPAQRRHILRRSKCKAGSLDELETG